jgi:hypothetical protein
VNFDWEFPLNELFPPSPNPGAEAPEIELAGPDWPDDLPSTLQLVSDEFLQHDTLALSPLLLNSASVRCTPGDNYGE